MLSRMHRVLIGTSAWLFPAAAVVAHVYPLRPAHLSAPYPPRGPVDAIVRILRQHLSLGQNIVVENRSGAGGSIRADLAAPIDRELKLYTEIIKSAGIQLQ